MIYIIHCKWYIGELHDNGKSLEQKSSHRLSDSSSSSEDSGDESSSSGSGSSTSSSSDEEKGDKEMS